MENKILTHCKDGEKGISISHFLHIEQQHKQQYLVSKAVKNVLVFLVF